MLDLMVVSQSIDNIWIMTVLLGYKGRAICKIGYVLDVFNKTQMLKRMNLLYML